MAEQVTAPASPRVAEDELVTEVSKLICFAERKYCGVPMCQKECKAPMSNHARMKRDKIATTIIALAQDAVLREVAEYAEANVRSVEAIKKPAHQGMFTAYSHMARQARAMMVKP